ncbi:hypothetical protein [Streptomyces sp. NPDC059378]|uniref:hypothetical protein n=1 Tax=Streptomyces sp. NPDC059378 TaxID=3346815 RepID=UPI0036867367
MREIENGLGPSGLGVSAAAADRTASYAVVQRLCEANDFIPPPATEPRATVRRAPTGFMVKGCE